MSYMGVILAFCILRTFNVLSGKHLVEMKKRPFGWTYWYIMIRTFYPAFVFFNRAVLDDDFFKDVSVGSKLLFVGFLHFLTVLADEIPIQGFEHLYYYLGMGNFRVIWSVVLCSLFGYFSKSNVISMVPFAVFMLTGLKMILFGLEYLVNIN